MRKKMAYLISHVAFEVKELRGISRKHLSPSIKLEDCFHPSIVETEAGMRDFALLNLMLRTGLRDIEVVRADCGDIQTVSGVDVLYIQGKGRPGKDNYVVLTESALAPIRDYLGMRDDSRGSSPLFTSVARRNSGERLTTRSVSRIVKEAMRKIGIDDPRYTAHSLRHTAITFSLLGGASRARGPANGPSCRHQHYDDLRSQHRSH